MKIIANQVLILGIISLIGYLAFKFKAIGKEQNSALVRVIMKITLPLLLFTTVAGMETNGKTLLNGLGIFGFAMLAILIFYILSYTSGRLLKLDKENQALHKAHTMFGNVVFLGFPLLDALIPGGKGLLYASLFQMGQAVLLWTWGILILNRGKRIDQQTGEEAKTERSWRSLLNPNTIAFILGFVVYFLGIKIPEVPMKAMSGLGKTTIYLSMVYVGAVLAQVKVTALIKNLRSWMLSFNTLLLGPFIIGLIIYFLQMTGLNWLENDAITVIILQAGMPCMIIVSVIAREMGLNDFQATQNIFVSTIVSLVSLPFLYYLVELFLLA